MNWLKKLMLLILEDLIKTDHDNKIAEIECKIPSTTGLSITAALNLLKIRK